MIYDSSFTDYERSLIRMFYDACENRARTQGIEHNWSVMSLCEEIELPILDFHKEGIFVQAIWVNFLTTMRKYLSESAFKYATSEEFNEAYRGMFTSLDEKEQELLWQTANWMSILFTMIPARKNKGLAMQIIPKLIEGWHIKYVTGSGQTKSTAYRVHIFETEGEITAHHRGRAKPKKPLTSKSHPRVTHVKSLPKVVAKKHDSDSEEEHVAIVKKRKYRNHSTEDYIPASIYEDPINASKYKSYLARVSRRCNSGDISEHTDVDNDSSDSDNESKHAIEDSTIELCLFDDCLQLFRDTSLSSVLSMSRGIENNGGKKLSSGNEFYKNELSLINPATLLSEEESFMRGFDWNDSYRSFSNFANSYTTHDNSDILDLLAMYQ